MVLGAIQLLKTQARTPALEALASFTQYVILVKENSGKFPYRECLYNTRPALFSIEDLLPEELLASAIDLVGTPGM